MATDGLDLLHVVAALSRLGVVDLRGGGSVHLEDGSILAVPAPGPGVPPPAELAADDLVRVGADGRPLAGRWSPPDEVDLDVELYRRRPDVRAVIHAQPPTALAFAAAGRPLAPLTHTEAALVIPSLPMVGEGRTASSPEARSALVEALADRPVVLRPGRGSIAVGTSAAEAGMLSQQLELLARVNEVAAGLGGGPRPALEVAPVDSARIGAQKAPASDFQDYFDAVAERRAVRHEPEPDVSDGSEAGLRRRVVAACHLLQAHGLVAHLEHVSVRLPDRSGFLITPRRHLGLLRPGELAVVDMAGEWRRGPLRPPPFLLFHRDLFLARPEVDAIVHTHQTVARGLVMAGHEVRALDSAGARWFLRPAAVYPTPDLMFDEAHRRGALAVLGDARVLHEASHGSDFLAASVEEATAGALLYERQARMWQLSARLGTPRPLTRDVLEAVAATDPADLDWWRYFRSELGRPA